jgi:scyllo-inositol 2-dehydrogenase (NADP+)
MEPAMSTVRVALIGYGLGGRLFHAPIIASVPGLRLAAVVTRDPARRESALADHPGVQLLDSIGDVCRRSEEYDLAVVTTPNRTHVEVATALVDAGIAVVVDKPLAVTAESARRLVEHAERQGVLLTAHQNRRRDSDLLTLRRLIEAGELGQVLRFESRFERWRPELVAGKWRENDEPEAGGGILLDLGSHLVDQALHLFGPVERVYAEIASRRGAAADDDAFLALSHASGVHSHLSMGALVGAPGPRMRVLGTGGAYVVEHLDGQEDALKAGRRPGPGWGGEPAERWGRLVRGDAVTAVPSERGDWPACYAAVADAVRTGDRPPVDPWDAVRVLDVLEAARRSARSAEAIMLA